MHTINLTITIRIFLNLDIVLSFCNFHRFIFNATNRFSIDCNDGVAITFECTFIFIHLVWISLIHMLKVINWNSIDIKFNLLSVYASRFANSDDIVIRDTHIKEWKLVYSPLNPIFEEMADLAAKSLQLDGIVAANSSEELESIMFNQELVAGIDFQHPPVRFQVICYHHFCLIF